MMEQSSAPPPGEETQIQPVASRQGCCVAASRSRTSLKTILCPALGLLFCICFDAVATIILASGATTSTPLLLLTVRLAMALVAPVVAVQLGTGAWTCGCLRAKSARNILSAEERQSLAVPLAAAVDSGSTAASPSSSLVSSATAQEQELQQMRSSYAQTEANAWKKTLVLAACFLTMTAQSIYVGTLVLAKDQYNVLQDYSLVAVIILVNLEFSLVVKVVQALTEQPGYRVPGLHPHPLQFREITSWVGCDTCGKRIGSQTGGYYSFYCSSCDFDACLHCYRKQQQKGSMAEGIRRGDKGPKPALDMSTTQSLKRALQLVWPFKGIVLLALVSIVLSQLLTLLCRLLTGDMINSLIGDDERSWKESLIIFAILSIIGAHIEGLQWFGATLVQRQITFETSKKMLCNLLRQDIAFFDGTMLGQLTTRMTNDLEMVVGPLQAFLNGFVANVCRFVGATIMCFIISWRLTVLVVTIMGPVIYLTRLYGRWTRRTWTLQHASNSDADAVTAQALRNLRTVRGFAATTVENLAFKKFTDQALNLGKRDSVTTGFYTLVMQLSRFAAMALVLWYGRVAVLEVKEGETPEFTIGELVTYNLYWNMVSGSIDGMLGLANSLIRSSTAAQRVFEIIDLEPDIPLDEGLALGDEPYKVEFKDVHFTYQMRPSKKVLRGVSFTVDPGTSVAFVGKSGAGKSTLVNLILRFYDPQEGCVMLNGRPLPEWNLRQHHRRVSVVTQETQIFNRSVRENLMYGLEEDDVTDDMLMVAAKKANAHDFIMDMEMGYMSMVGEGGSRLSGGQKQRLAIARALLRNPALLLLDEATSALDAESEGFVQEALEAMMKTMVGRSSILLIAHRLSTVISSDKIVVMDAGTVSEQGSHSELLQQDGAYAALVSAQLSAAANTISEDAAPPKEPVVSREPNFTVEDAPSKPARASATAGGLTLADADAPAAEVCENSRKGSEPLLKDRRIGAEDVEEAATSTPSISTAPEPSKPGSCRACLKYRGRVAGLAVLIALDYTASIALDMGSKQVVYLALCSSRFVLVIIGMFFGVQLGLGLLCTGRGREEDLSIHQCSATISTSLSCDSSPCCQVAAAAASSSTTAGSTGSGSSDSLDDGSNPTHHGRSSSSRSSGSGSSGRTGSALVCSGPAPSKNHGAAEADAKIQQIQERSSERQKHHWKRNLVLACCGVIVTAQSIFCGAQVVISAGLEWWEAVAMVAMILSMNAQFLVVKSVVDKLTQDEGVLINGLHQHRLVYQTKTQWANCNVCSERLGPKTGGHTCLTCPTCDFNFRVCTYCFRKHQAQGGGVAGGSLRCDKGPRPSPQLSSMDLIMRLLSILKPMRWFILLLFVAIVVEQIGQVALPHCRGTVFDILIRRQEDRFDKALESFVAVAVSTAFSSMLSAFAGKSITQAMYYRMRYLMFESLLKQDVALFDSTTIGNLTSRMTIDLNQVIQPVSQLMWNVLPNIILFVGGMFMCFATSWELTVLCCTMVGPVIYITRMYAIFARGLYLRILTARADANSIATESLRNIRIVRAYAADHVEMAAYGKHIESASKSTLLDAWWNTGLAALNGYKDFGTGLAITWFGGLTILDSSRSGGLTIGQLIMYNLYWDMMTNALQAIQSQLNMLIRANSAATRVFEIMDMQPDIKQDTGVSVPVGPLEVAFKDVHFTYQMRPDKKVLNGLSFTIPAGETVAVVGRSGAGKSTLVSLIMRCYDPQGGHVVANGRPLQELHLLEYVRRVGAVTQETQVFCRSVWENLTYGLQNGAGEDVEITESDVIAAAEKANIHSFIVDLDEGYKSLIGEGGVNMSGGQKQRLAIARALLRKPSLLLLDEATSALDAVNEALVQEALEGMVQAMAGNCSVMLIAHRLSTVVKSDNIVVMDKGRVVESGKHENLLGNAGVYAQLVQRQIAAQANTLEE